MRPKKSFMVGGWKVTLVSVFVHFFQRSKIRDQNGLRAWQKSGPPTKISKPLKERSKCEGTLWSNILVRKVQFAKTLAFVVQILFPKCQTAHNLSIIFYYGSLLHNSNSASAIAISEQIVPRNQSWCFYFLWVPE